jgi:phosphate transport system substrate-binding protein
MKRISLYLLAAVVFLAASTNRIAAQKKELKGTISLSGAFALYPMAVKWAEEFKKINPKVKIDISAGGAGKGMTDALAKVVDIGMVSREIYPDEIKKGALGIAVAKDAVIPTISEQNPVLKDILAKGLKKEAANNIFITGKVKTRSDACGAGETWAKYFGKKQEDILGVGVFGDPGLALAVKKDPFGIGYNNIAYAYDNKTNKPFPGLRVIPLDLNNNGKIDADENFYNTQDELINAIATGKYPSPPARDLYFVTSGKPTNPLLAEFITWVLTEGQKYVLESGYINLPKEKITEQLKKIK